MLRNPSSSWIPAKGLLALLLVLASNLSCAAPGPVEREYADAVKSFRAGKTSEAFGRFVDLANRGDVDSARIALFLHQYGEPLYGKYWDAGPQNAAYWESLIRHSGTSARPTGEFPPTVLNPKPSRTKLASKPAGIKNIATAK